MKKLILLFVLVGFFSSCDRVELNQIEEIILSQASENEASIIGRWVLQGFESNIRYDFTETKRYTIYGDGSGNFPSLEEFLEANPTIPSNDWYYDGETVVVDLNFGNFSRLVPDFKCENAVADMVQENGDPHSTFYREGHDISACH